MWARKGQPVMVSTGNKFADFKVDDEDDEKEEPKPSKGK
jgi:hypothetical protein